MADTIKLRPIYRIGVFVPPDHVEDMMAAILALEPLGDDRYDSVHWIIGGVTERFRPLAGSNPTVGSTGEVHGGESTLLMFSIDRNESRLQRLLRDAIMPAHPWESPSIFVDESFQPMTLPTA